MPQTTLNFWQSLPLKMDPVAFTLGPVDVHWYGLMYLVAIVIVWLLLAYRIKREHFPMTLDQLTDYIIVLIVGVLVGARLGYVLFYQPGYYLSHPLEIILPFSFTGGFHFTGIAGMSFHGGLIGTIIAAVIYCKRRKISFWRIVDFTIPAIPLGYTFGRLGNFINGELYGRVTQSALGMYFPQAGDGFLRHPSQLYEALFEGLVLFAILWGVRKRNYPTGAMLAFFMFGYGFFRFIIEFFRQPDEHLGFIVGFLSMGQLLCLAMMIAAVVLYIYLRHASQLKINN